MGKIDVQNILDNANVTANSEQIAVLKKYFPNCFDKKGNFLVDKLSEIVKTDGVDLSHEGYKLDWLGKSYARLLANEKPRTFITADIEHNNKAENRDSNNLLIKGDNLEVLKHLKNAYTEAVKVIYIDPPYNTGSDGFVYQDDRKFSKEELANLANVSEEDAERILNYTDEGSNSHSAWLTFIYPRLYVARELLREDGVIFISIDNNEQAQLKLLCDELFGEENFIADLIWQRRTSSSFSDNNVSIDHEAVLCYKKRVKKEFHGIEKNFKNYSNPDNDSRGEWTLGDLTVGMTASMRPNQAYDLIDTSTGLVYPFNSNRVWAYIPSSMDVLIKEDRVFFPNDNSKRPMLKRFRSDLEGKTNPFSSLMINQVGLNTESTKTIQSLFGKSIFDYSKPLSLIKTLLTQITSKDSLILDFFAGSGTTAHAVMDLNKDGGNRQYILVQLPEKTDTKSEAYKAGYNTIFDITKARIEKAGEKIKIEKTDYKGDLGFKIFQTTDLPKNYNAEIDKLSEATQGELWDGSTADDELLRAILTTWTLYDRILLTTDLQTIDLSNGYKTHYGVGKESNTLYLMHKGFVTDNIKDIIDKLDNDKNFTPKKIVMYGHNFDSKSQRELSEALHNFKNKKQLEVDIIKRY